MKPVMHHDAAGVGAPIPAAVVGATSWTLAVGSVVVLAATRPVVGTNHLFFVVDVVGAAVYGTVAAIVLVRRVHAVPILMAVASVGAGLAALGFAWSELVAFRPGFPAGEVLSPLQNTAWIPGTLALFLVVPWLLRDHRLGARGRLGVVLGAATTAWYFWARTFTATGTVALVVPVVVVGTFAATDVVWRRYFGPERERVGLGWLACGTGAMALSYVPLAVPGLPWTLTPLIHLATQAFYPVAILVVLLRQRLWGLDLAVSRAAVAGALVAILVAAYLAVAGVAALLLTDRPVAAQAIAAIVVALAVSPVRAWATRRVHRLVYGEAGDAERAVRSLGRRLTTSDPPARMLADLAAGIGTALRLESVTVLREGGTAARWGTPTGAETRVPLTAGGELVVTAPPGEILGARSVRALNDLAVVVDAGTVVARSAEDLAVARQRLTDVRLAERRTLRRELHDGLGPSLAGIRLGLHAARNMLPPGTEPVRSLVDSLLSELDVQVEAVRTLARGVLPPALDELGLAAALDELAAVQSRGGFTVTLDVGPDVAVPRPVAAAAYGIAVEAVTNARRHSGAPGCRIRVGSTAQMLEVRIEDEGGGLAADARAGIGTHTMRERAEEVGGTVTVTPADPCGTVVAASLPRCGA